MKTDAGSTLPPIAGYHPTTLIDWPGRLAAVVFLPQCNLQCPFCHAGTLLESPRETIPIEAVLGHLAARRGWLDGVVICGGEPTVWPGLAALCRKFRGEGLAIKLDTNGTQPDRLAELLRERLVDAVAMDVKAPLDERYHEAAGWQVDLEAVNRSIDLLMSSDIEYEFRTTVCPALLDEPEIRAMGERIAGARRWVLQRFEPANALDHALREVQPYDQMKMEMLADIGRLYVARCLIRGQPHRQSVSSGIA